MRRAVRTAVIFVGSLGFAIFNPQDELRATDFKRAPSTSEGCDGDAVFRQRNARRPEDGMIDPANIDKAIRCYEAGILDQPDSFELRFKLMEALYFKGHFVAADLAEQKQLSRRSIELTNEVMRLLAAKAGNGNLSSLDRARQIELLRGVAEAPRAHFWAAINWGIWGMTFGYYASAREGVAARIRDHAAMVVELDDTYADGGGLRLLGRMHSVTPRVPFATWWIDRAKGVELLRRAHAISNHDPRNAFFLAEALLEHAPEKRDEALGLLRDVAGREPDPEYFVEEMETIAAARQRLRAEEAK